MQELTIEQKIELMKLASTIDKHSGVLSASIEETLTNYNQMLKAITTQLPQPAS